MTHTKEELSEVESQFSKFRLLTQDDPVETEIESIYKQNFGKYIYLQLNTGSNDFPVYIRLKNRNISLTNTESIFTILSKISKDQCPTIDNITGKAIHINPTIDSADDAMDSDLQVIDTKISVDGYEYDTKLLIGTPEKKTELTANDEETLAWKTDISDWYHKNKNETGEILTTISSIEEIQTDSKHKVTFTIQANHHHVRFTITVPPDGNHIEQTKQLIEDCGGKIDLMEGSQIVLYPYSTGPIETHNGHFNVLSKDQYETQVNKPNGKYTITCSCGNVFYDPDGSNAKCQKCREGIENTNDGPFSKSPPKKAGTDNEKSKNRSSKNQNSTLGSTRKSKIQRRITGIINLFITFLLFTLFTYLLFNKQHPLNFTSGGWIIISGFSLMASILIVDIIIKIEK